MKATKRPRSFSEALRREAKATTKPANHCEGCQQLTRLLSQAIADNTQLIGQFAQLDTNLADMKHARNTNRIWA